MLILSVYATLFMWLYIRVYTFISAHSNNVFVSIYPIIVLKHMPTVNVGI